MIVLGIDPGSRFTGYGLLEKNGKAKAKLLSYGVIATKNNSTFEKKLELIYDGISELIKKHKPDFVALEDSFFGKNVKSMTKLSQARGVCLLSAAKNNLPVFEYPPTTVKMSVVGYGRSTKEQVSKMVKNLLKLKETLTEDESDALAIAFCHIFNSGSPVDGKFKGDTRQSWENFLKEKSLI